MSSGPSMSNGSLPKGIVGAFLGAIGALPLLPIVSGLAKRFASTPTLPGLVGQAVDSKTATYSEAAVLLVGLPLAALLFGRIIPDWLNRRRPATGLSLEWATGGFATAFLLSQRGVRPKIAFLVGVALYVLLVYGILTFRNSFAFRRWFVRKSRRSALLVFLAGASLDFARRSGLDVPTNAVGDLLGELILAGATLLAIACLVARVKRDKQAFVAKVADLSWIAFLSAGGVLAFPEIPAYALAAPVVIMLLPVGSWRSVRSPALLRGALIILALVFSWRVHWLGSYPLDVFEEGISLSYANEYRYGARPYIDTYPLHGWGADGGVDAVTFSLVPATVHASRVRQTSWASLAFLCFGAVCLAVYRSAWWATVAFLLTLSVRWLFHERQLLAVAALLLLVVAVQENRRVVSTIAGALAGWATFHSLDFGLMIVAAGLSGLLFLALLRPQSGRPYALLLFFAGGLILGAIPLLLILLLHGAGSEFAQVSFREIPRWIDAAWGQPAGSAWEALLTVRTETDLVQVLSGRTGPMPSLFLLILLATCATALLMRFADRRATKVDTGFLICLVFACTAMRGVLGRADEEHLGRYGFFAGMTGAWLLRSAWHSGRARGWVMVAAGVLVFAGFHPIRALEWQLATVENSARRDKAVPRSPIPRGGGIGFPRDQAAELASVVAFLNTNLDQHETFFDFSNEPGLYFLADRRMPIRFHGPAQYGSPAKQQEVISALERVRPPLAILPFGALGALGGVSNRDRAPDVARYLDAHYQLEAVVAGRPIARRRGPTNTVTRGHP
jgi:hypothetical protein